MNGKQILTVPSQRFLKLEWYRNTPRGLREAKRDFSFSGSGGERERESAFLTSSQAVLRLLLQGPRSGNRCSKPRRFGGPTVTSRELADADLHGADRITQFCAETGSSDQAEVTAAFGIRQTGVEAPRALIMQQALAKIHEDGREFPLSKVYTLWNVSLD